MRLILAVLLVCLAYAAPRPALADDRDACFQATLDTKGDKAIEICGKLIKSGRVKGQDLATTLNNRGLGYMKNDDLDLAEADFNEALKINPKYVYAYDNRGDVWRYRGLYDRAITDYNAAIRYDPTFVSAYLDRGQAYEKMGNKRAARADYQAVLDMPGQGRPIDKWAKGEAKRHLDDLGSSD